MQVPFNKTFKNQQKKLVPATFKKAVISAVYTNLFTADVFFVGNNQTIIKNVPVANNVDIIGIQPGDRCRVDVFDESNPNDQVVAYIYGKTARKKFNTGEASVVSTFGGTTIPHNLMAGGQKVVPDIVIITQLDGIVIFETQNPDDTNIYLKASAGTHTVRWTVVKF